ncbi:CPBP family intramembrane glutamic endopeptidase [Streptomyces sp. NPDC052494]|uniref:CPBP family intramembrane glutamic endopeptidase n=1 Tax=Streptomyces sp. NPDC052494 TaxID=3365692 RepID=UPI0037D03A79
MPHRTGERRTSWVRRFFDRPTTGKAILVIVVYLAFYLLAGQLIGLFAGGEIDTDDVLGTGGSIFFALVLPVAIGALALVGLTAAAGWLRDVFGRQDVRGRRWMWIAPVLVLLAVVGHVGGTGWDAWDPGRIVLILLLGVFVGLAEELATRGLTVRMLRGAGRPERFVMVVSSLLFALMHLTNLLSGMELGTVLVTVVYTFAFGTCMYLSMRVTGTIWTAIVLHALTDPTTFLATGGLDKAVTAQSGGWALLASAATILMVVFAFVAVFLVRDDRPKTPLAGGNESDPALARTLPPAP